MSSVKEKKEGKLLFRVRGNTKHRHQLCPVQADSNLLTLSFGKITEAGTVVASYTAKRTAATYSDNRGR